MKKVIIIINIILIGILAYRIWGIYNMPLIPEVSPIVLENTPAGRPIERFKGSAQTPDMNQMFDIHPEKLEKAKEKKPAGKSKNQAKKQKKEELTQKKLPKVLGVVTHKDETIAIIEKQDKIRKRNYITIREGEQVDSLILKEIKPDRVTFGREEGPVGSVNLFKYELKEKSDKKN